MGFFFKRDVLCKDAAVLQSFSFSGGDAKHLVFLALVQISEEVDFISGGGALGVQASDLPRGELPVILAMGEL